MGIWVELSRSVENIAALGFKVLAAGGALIAIGQWYARRSSLRRLAVCLYTTEVDLRRATRYYVEPDLAEDPPLQALSTSLKSAGPIRAFTWLNQSLSAASPYRFYLLLAEAGLGKSSLLLQYARRRNARPLRSSDLLLCRSAELKEELVEKIPIQDRKVLLIDAFDEDPISWMAPAQEAQSQAAVVRLHEILKMGRTFEKVLVACRSEFFETMGHMPADSGVRRDPRPAGVSANHELVRVRLLPFEHRHVKAYIRRRYPLSPRRRRAVMQLVERIPHLAMRPMLLCYAEDILRASKGGGPIALADIYRAMVEGWLVREHGAIAKKVALL